MAQTAEQRRELARERMRLVRARMSAEQKSAMYLENNQRVRDWRRNNPNKVAAMPSVKANRLVRYRMSMSQFEQMLLSQDHCCRACGKRCPVDGHRDEILHIDHCHQTGRVRGLLCRGCNSALGHLMEDPRRARSLADYMEKHCVNP